MFAGEFGWEIIHWQAYCRKESRKYDQTFFISVNESDALYTDFANKGMVRADVTLAWVKDRLIPFEEQEFIKFGDEPNSTFDILIHARNARVSSKNYPIEMWSSVVQQLPQEYKVASIGTAAFHVPETHDLRNITLDRLMNFMAGAKVILGPSSGPIHLATLCGCPQVVWGDGRTWRGQLLKDRYETSWNPFGTPATYLEQEHWQPEPEQVVEATRRYIDESGSNHNGWR